MKKSDEKTIDNDSAALRAFFTGSRKRCQGDFMFLFFSPQGTEGWQPHFVGFCGYVVLDLESEPSLFKIAFTALPDGLVM